MKISISKNSWYTIAGILVILAAWELLSRVIGSKNILPGPVFTAETLVSFLGDKSFYNSLGLTVTRGLAGFLIAIILSLLTGIPSGLNSRIESFL